MKVMMMKINKRERKQEGKVKKRIVMENERKIQKKQTKGRECGKEKEKQKDNYGKGRREGGKGQEK